VHRFGFERVMNWKELLSSQRFGQANTPVEQSRSAFEQDYDRIIFSHPFRRLQDKTQVHPLPEHDFVHTRLTHSLEVSSVGRSLGKRVGEVILQRNPDLNSNYSPYDFGAIVAAGSLAHDLGNPPFGHSGEEALSDFFKHHSAGKSFETQVTPDQWKDLVRFEGNAQGFRLLTRNQYGLKLTFATLGAFTKYPCPSYFSNRNKSKKSQKKFGFFESEVEPFKNIASSLGLQQVNELCWNRHPLAFLVEAADDICYSIIDLEDGCRLGLISFDETVELLAGILGPKLKPEKLRQVVGLNEKLGVLRAMTINSLTDDCTSVFLENEKQILDGTFDTALTDAGEFQEALKKISDASVIKIYRARPVMEIEAAGFEALPGLLEEFIYAALNLKFNNQPRKFATVARLMPLEIESQILSSLDTYSLLRIVIDFVSGLTDRHALSLFRKIKGIST
jgi:dGTPase